MLDGKCLSQDEKNLTLQPCVTLSQGYRWHLVQVEVEYKWGDGPVLWEKPSDGDKRVSEKWAKHDPRVEQSPTQNVLMLLMSLLIQTKISVPMA